MNQRSFPLFENEIADFGVGWNGVGTKDPKGVFILFFFSSGLDFASLLLEENKVKGE